MSHRWKSTSLWLLFAVAGSAAYVAAQSTARPGDPTEARVWVENRLPNEAVPVLVERTNGTVDVHLSSIDQSVVLAARSARQRWEYRVVGFDPAALELAGNDGWEAVGLVPSSGAASILLKRPR